MFPGQVSSPVDNGMGEYHNADYVRNTSYTCNTFTAPRLHLHNTEIFTQLFIVENDDQARKLWRAKNVQIFAPPKTFE